MLDLRVNDPSLSQACQLAISSAKDVCHEPIESDPLGDWLDKGSKAAGDEDCFRAPCPHRPDQRRSTAIGPYAVGQALLDSPLLKSFEQGDPLPQRTCKVELSVHRPLG